MEKNKKIIISLIVLFFVLLSLTVSYSFSANIESDEIVVKSVTPVYDENSGVVLTENNEVIFSDKNQKVDYNVVIENISGSDLKFTNTELTQPTEDFLKYEAEVIDKDEILKANETKEVVVSLKTIEIEGWGRNFNDVLIANIIFEKLKNSNLIEDAINPNTSDRGIVLVLGVATCAIGVCIIIFSKNKLINYLIIIVTAGSILTIANATDTVNIQIITNASFKSQNVMKPSGCNSEDEQDLYGCVDYWQYHARIINFYIENELREITDYKYKFDVSLNQDEKVIAYLVENKNSYDKWLDIYNFDVYLIADGIIYPNPDASYYFGGTSRLKSIYNLAGLDTSNVINMSHMFSRAGQGSENFTLDVSGFDTSKVTDMSYMFSDAGNLNSQLTIDVSNFDTSNVTDMSGMFSGTGTYDETLELDLTNFDTSKVTDMSYMFYDLKPSLIFGLNKFDTSNVTNMSYMFASLVGGDDFTLDLSSFNTSNVTDMSGMFDKFSISNKDYILDLRHFDTSNVIDMSRMFWNTGWNNTAFTLDVSHFDTKNVTDMSEMFRLTGYSSPNFTLDVSNFDTNKVTNMSSMFRETGYSNPNFTLDISNFNTSEVTDMSSMFEETGYNSMIFTLDVSNFDTSKVTNMNFMFEKTGYNSTKFSLNLSNFDTSNVTEMAGMFWGTGYNSENFTLYISNFDTSKVTNMNRMFEETGYNSTMLDTTITIRNPYTFHYDRMFRGVATKPWAQITVNYTTKTEDLVKDMIRTKSFESNVVKGKLVS